MTVLFKSCFYSCLVNFWLCLSVCKHGFSLIISQLLRNHYFYRNIMVSFLMVIRRQFLYSVVRDLFPFLVLSSRRNLDCHVTVKSFNNKVTTQDGLSNVQVQLCVDVSTLSLEVGMGPHLNVYYEITMWTTLTCVTLFSHTEVDSVINSLRDVDCLFSCRVCSSSTPASHARISDYLSNTIAISTNLLDHERTLSDRLETLATTTTTS